MSGTKSELRILREQIASDFNTTWKVLGENADRWEQLARDVARTARETGERLRQVEGRMRLAEQRFGRFMDIVEGDLRGTVDREDFDSLEERVARLEERRPA